MKYPQKFSFIQANTYFSNNFQGKKRIFLISAEVRIVVTEIGISLKKNYILRNWVLFYLLYTML